MSLSVLIAVCEEERADVCDRGVVGGGRVELEEVEQRQGAEEQERSP